MTADSRKAWWEALDRALEARGLLATDDVARARRKRRELALAAELRRVVLIDP